MLLRLLTVTAMIAALIRQPEFLVPIGSQRCHQRVPQHVQHQHRDRPENLNKVFLICLSGAQKEHGEIYTLDKQPSSTSGIAIGVASGLFLLCVVMVASRRRRSAPPGSLRIS